jgi:hypothetical protein
MRKKYKLLFLNMNYFYSASSSHEISVPKEFTEQRTERALCLRNLVLPQDVSVLDKSSKISFFFISVAPYTRGLAEALLAVT